MSVTIGDQKFVKDSNKGWMDAKTKQPADTGLIKLLDSLMVEEPEAKKLRVKIDRNVEPVSINGQKFVYDVNQGWIDEKTKVRAAESLQRTLNMAGLGISGTAGLQKVKEAKAPAKKSGGGTLVNNRNTAINKPLVAMINQLASIDGYLKQQLQNKQIISSKEIAQAKEASIEAKDSEQAKTFETPDAEKETSSNILGATALAGLIALQFDPVKETIKSLANFGKETVSYIIDIAKTVNSAFEWLLGDAAAPRGSSGAGNAGSKEYKVADYLNSAPAFASYTPTPPTLTPQSVSSPSILSSDPKVREQAFAQKTAPSSIPATPAATNSSTPASKPAAPANAFVTTKPSMLSNDPTQRAQAIVEKDKTETHGLKAKGGRTSGKAAPVIPKNNIVALGKYLQGQGIKVSENPAFGPVGEHSKNSRHYTGQAIDLNIVAGRDVDNPAAAAQFDALKPQLEAAGYNVIWRSAGHYDHMHVSVGGPEGIGGFGGGESPMATAVDTITGVMESAKNIFGKVGAALIGTKDYTKRELTTPASKLGPLAKSYEMAKTDAMADSRTPKPPPSSSKSVSPPNINPNKSSPVIQTPATESDMGSVNYYLERFGFMPAQSEIARI